MPPSDRASSAAPTSVIQITHHSLQASTSASRQTVPHKSQRLLVENAEGFVRDELHWRVQHGRAVLNAAETDLELLFGLAAREHEPVPRRDPKV
jgi:hypothetical protein